MPSFLEGIVLLTDIACGVYDLGRADYESALDVQLSLVERCRQGDISAALVLVEHEPVITIGAGAKGCNLLLSRSRLNELGILVVSTDRGGDVTYHGPGQIVAYPIVNLKALGLDAHEYLRRLEAVVIDTLKDYGLEGSRHGPAGVWVGDCKVCSIGIAIRRSVTYHGLALNVTPNLAHFAYINPCGLNSAQITSLAELLENPPSIEDVALSLKRNFESVFGVHLVDRQPATDNQRLATE